MSPREFAIEVVKKLQQAGYQALWAGGCVRDQLFGRTPKDYDVATNATPDQVRDVFGKKRTLPIGASFGVITVLGPKSAGQIEVATFRRDGGYSDGRHPDSVEFTDAQEDALRRDFTINGMFFDPTTERVHDYVGGQEDLKARQIRAIGDPHQRIEEDKLRMLRGIRFASTFGFDLEPETMAAIQAHAPEIKVVSGERIGAEMRRMLSSPNRAVAVELLRQSGLLAETIPDGSSQFADDEAWKQIVGRLSRLDGEFESAASILLESIIVSQGIDELFESWKLTNLERKSMEWICNHWKTLDQADQLPWSQIQPLLVHSEGKRALAVAASSRSKPSRGVELCQERLAWPNELLDPKPFLDGGDLIRLGIERGPLFSKILARIRAAQLDGEIATIEQAEAFVYALVD